MRFVGDIAEDAEVRAIASGAITDGGPVIVNADGTVQSSASVTTTNTEALASAFAEVGSGHTAATGVSITYDTNAKRFVIMFKDSNGYGTAIVAEIDTSNFTLSYGTAVVFHSADISEVFRASCFDSTNNKHIIVYEDSSSDDGQVIVGTVDSSDNSISFGSAVEYAGSNNSSAPSICYDSTNNRVVIAFSDNANSNYGTAIVGTVSGTSVSFGTEAVFASTSMYANPMPVHDVGANKIVIQYIDGGNSNYGTGVVGTVDSSDNSISFGTPSVYNSSLQYGDGTPVYDSTNNKTVFLFNDYADGEKGKAIVVSISGTSISYGTEVTFESQKGPRIAATFDSNIGKVAVGYYDETPTNMRHISGTVSGTDISFGSELDITSDNAQPSAGAAAFDPNTGKVLYVARNVAQSNKPYAAVVQVGGDSTSVPLTSENFIGFAHAAYADGQKATVKTTGSIARNIPQIASASSTLGTAVSFESATTSRIASCFDSTNNRIVVSYVDSGSDDDGTVAVGTVSASDNSISWGTPVHFNSNVKITDSQIIHDSNSNKIVVAYTDEDNSFYGTGIVGTIDTSDNSISFGSPTVYESANTNTSSRNGITFDSNSNKVVIVYTDQGNSNYGTAVVGTVSGTSISFGTPVVFESAQAIHMGATFDTSNNKVVIAYRDVGNSDYGTAIVGTVSGTSISFGTAVVYESAESDWNSITFDSNSNKVVISYQDKGNSGYGTAIVGTVSGTSISFGTAVVYESGSVNYTAIDFDSNLNKVIIGYEDTDNSEYGTFVIGTVSGTSISFTSPAVFYSGELSWVGVSFDSNAKRSVFTYRDADNSNNGRSVVLQPAGILENLTIGQQYFVQTDGSLGTSADSPSVIAGTAIGASDIIVKG
jgi:hypothetical protein